MTLSTLVFSLFVSMQPMQFQIQKSVLKAEDWLQGQKIERLEITQDQQQMCFTLLSAQTKDSVCLDKARLSGPHFRKGAYVLEAHEGAAGFMKVTLASQKGSDYPIDHITIEKNLGTANSLYLRQFELTQIDMNDL